MAQGTREECAIASTRRRYAEAIEIVFDPDRLSFRELLEFFFQVHDPTTRNRQGNDVGTSYRSAIFTTSDEQRRIAEDTIADVNASGLWPGRVVTEVAPAGPFWAAEPEHQDYLERIPNGYTCHFVRPGWKLPVRDKAHAGGRRPAKLREIATIEDLNRVLSEFIKSRFTDSSEIRILEAGCGNRWPLDLGGLNYRLTGIDIDADGLELRKSKQNDLDVAILGDLCTVELEANQFDVVYSSYVLEHVDGAERALENFVRWLKPGGYMLLKFPDRNTVFGFITRIVPFRLHVFYKKYIYRLPHAGEPGHGPFPTVYDPVVSRQGMYEFCAAHGLEILQEYSTNFYLKRLGRLARVVRPVLKSIQLVSLQRLQADYNNLVLIIRKPAGRPAEVDASPLQTAGAVPIR